MFGIGHWEILAILVIVLIIFGAGKLPEVGSALGKGIKNFKKSVTEPAEEPKAEIPEKSPEPEKEESPKA